MRLTDFTDYTLRALIYLGVHRDELVTIQQIADSYGISKNHLMKVAHQLGQLGVVSTTRGRGGGLRLNREPEDIRVGEVIRSVEFDLALAECFDTKSNACTINAVCALKGALGRAREAFFSVLDEYTLQDLCRPETKLVRLLRVR